MGPRRWGPLYVLDQENAMPFRNHRHRPWSPGTAPENMTCFCSCPFFRARDRASGLVGGEQRFQASMQARSEMLLKLIENDGQQGRA